MFIQLGNTLNNIFRSGISGIGENINTSLSHSNKSTDTTNLSSASKQLSKILTDLRSEMSVTNAEDIKNTLKLDPSTGLYQLITPDEQSVNDLTSALAENGKSMPKPDETMNDVQWGAMVRLGQTIGIEDSEVLASLTAKDLDLFFNEFIDKEGISDPSIKQFQGTDSFWKTVFKTDKNGEFLKENGKAVRNTDFEFITINKPQPNIKVTSNADIVTHNGSYKFNSEADYSTELSAMSPEAILRWDDAINYKNLNMKGAALGASSSGAKGIWQAELTEEQTLESFFKKELGFYMLQTSTNFNKPFMKTADTHYTIEKFRFS